MDTVETKVVKEIIVEANEQMEDVSAIELALGGKGMERALLFGTMSHVLDFDDVKFTLQYCLAAALFDRKITLQIFTDENVNREKIQVLMSKVVMAVDKSKKRARDRKKK